ncbi:MAG: hypothetical protein ACKVS9_14180 [Phycisphaerae bacterium]
MSSESNAVSLEELKNIVRALATPVTALHANIRSFISAERILVDDFGDWMAMARDAEKRSGIAWIDRSTWTVIEKLEEAVSFVRDAIYSDGSAWNDDEFDMKWADLHRLARDAVQILGWQALVDYRQFSG